MDTDTCIHVMRGREPVVARVSAQAPDDLVVSAITAYELRFGAMRCAAERRTNELGKVDYLLDMVGNLAFTDASARHAAQIRAALEAEGQRIGPMDTLIAACALEYGLTVVTGNIREFGRIAGLECEDWG